MKRHNPVNAGQKLCFVIVNVPGETKITVDNNEIDSYAWILPEQLPTYIKRKEYLEVIENVMKECVL